MLLVKLYHHFKRQGHIEGIFTCTREQYESILGKEIYFGEALGKHSQVYVTMVDGETLKVVTEDEEFIKKFEELDLCSGYDPFDYLDEE